MEAFIRPEPVDPPSIAELRARVAPGAYHEQRALVVGGSRGLGDLFLSFLRFYVDAFEELCRLFADGREGPLWVLYPSSTAVESRPQGLTEYAMAKAAGELLCQDIEKLYPALTIAAPCLPRIFTDQTATVSLTEAETAAEVAIRLLGG